MAGDVAPVAMFVSCAGFHWLLMCPTGLWTCLYYCQLWKQKTPREEENICQNRLLMIIDILQRYNCHLSQILLGILEWKSCDKVSHQIRVPGISFTGGLIKILHCWDQVVGLIRATYTCVWSVESYFTAQFNYRYPWKSSTERLKLLFICPFSPHQWSARQKTIIRNSDISLSLFHIYPCMTAFMPQSWVAEWYILEHIKRIKPWPLISQTTFIRVFSLTYFFLLFKYLKSFNNILPE